MTSSHPSRTPAAILALSLSLAGCDLGPTTTGGDDPDPEPAETPLVPATDPGADSESSPAASIIREDLRSEEPVAPAEPLAVVVPFPLGGSDLDAAAERLLAGVLDSPALAEGWPVVVGGHTDSAGNDAANLRASRARAEAVAAWLVERGVADERITVIPFGEQNPIAPNALPDGSPDEEGRARNRRVEITIAPQDAAAEPKDVADRADDA